MKTFTEWLEANVNEAGTFTSMLRSLRNEKLPPNITSDQKDAYEKLRSTGMSHEASLKTVIGTPVLHRNISKHDQDYHADIEGRWGNR